VDIIERKEAGEALRDSELRLRAVITNASAVLFALDNEGVITLSEGKGMEPLGLEPTETVGQSVLDLYHDRPELLEYY
jgi:PAS domain-containing protein